VTGDGHSTHEVMHFASFICKNLHVFYDTYLQFVRIKNFKLLPESCIQIRMIERQRV